MAKIHFDGSLSSARITLDKLLSDDFLSKNTDFKSLDEFFTAFGIDVRTPQDLIAIPENDLDAFVRSHSRYDSWESLCRNAQMYQLPDSASLPHSIETF